jgi:hypothetical protein
MTELRDQSLHASAALVALLPLALLPCVLTGAWAGFCIGIVREITEEGEISFVALKAALGSRLDLTFWTLGGALTGLAA